MFNQFLMCVILTCAPITTSHNTIPIVPNVVLQQQVGYKPYSKILNEREVKCLTDNIYFEARNEKDIGKKAVALVTLNRLKDEDYPNTICKIVHQRNQYKCQFAWTCERKNKIYDPFAYNECRKIAKHVMLNYEVMYDVTKGATNFHRKDIRPEWANPRKKTVAIGKHVFYKL
jgi:spore germination cell wall hydrolase CwlJ-like protein